MKYTIFIKKGCPFCKNALKLLDEISEDEDELEIVVEGENFTNEDFKKKFGKGATYPRIYFGKDYIGGYDNLKGLMKDI